MGKEDRLKSGLARTNLETMPLLDSLHIKAIPQWKQKYFKKDAKILPRWSI